LHHFSGSCYVFQKYINLHHNQEYGGKDASIVKQSPFFAPNFLELVASYFIVGLDPDLMIQLFGVLIRDRPFNFHLGLYGIIISISSHNIRDI
jgi:hypothetical protein